MIPVSNISGYLPENHKAQVPNFQPDKNAAEGSNLRRKCFILQK